MVNNYTTANTGDGSFAMTDGAVNVATNVTDMFHVGAQAYIRNVGRLANGQVQLDWGYGDYQVRDWLGFRAGKVKTPPGLYTDTQDIGLLHTWALLPQANYPTDLRSTTIAHSGGDVYGETALSRLGSLSYSAYGGARPVDMTSDSVYGLEDQGFRTISTSGINAGFDVRWQTPVKGLKVGSSSMYSSTQLTGTLKAWPAWSDAVFQTTSGYGEYRRRGATLATEYRVEDHASSVFIGGRPQPSRDAHLTSYFISAALRLGLNICLVGGICGSRIRSNGAGKLSPRTRCRIGEGFGSVPSQLPFEPV
jgi:hypothetical protein